MEYRRRYGNGGSVDRLRMAFGGKMRYENGGEIPKFFVARGFDNRGDDPSGREIAGVFMNTEEGVRQIDPKELLEMFPEAEGDMIKAYRMAGIVAEPSGEGAATFPQMRDQGYNQRLMRGLGVENMDDLRQKLNISRVDYQRQRDLQKAVPGFQEQGGMQQERREFS